MDLKNRLIRNERGSISLVVITLFLVTVVTSIVVTDIASVAIAKRSLTQVTEAAAQRGVRNLDLQAYYSGEFDLTTMAGNLFGVGPDDPGVPIDCSKALGDVQEALVDWSNGDKSLRRGEITVMRINTIDCDGFGIQLITEATARLPIAIPIFKVDSVQISARVSTTNTRKSGFSPFGIRIF
jgi:hypothetical protein